MAGAGFDLETFMGTLWGNVKLNDDCGKPVRLLLEACACFKPGFSMDIYSQRSDSPHIKRVPPRRSHEGMSSHPLLPSLLASPHHPFISFCCFISYDVLYPPFPLHPPTLPLIGRPLHFPCFLALHFLSSPFPLLICSSSPSLTSYFVAESVRCPSVQEIYRP